MNRKTKTSLVSACAGIFLIITPVSSAQELVASWTFEELTDADELTAATYGPLLSTTGSGEATGVHLDEASRWTNPGSDGSDKSFSSDHWAIGDYYQFEVSTLNFSDIEISWDMDRSGTAPPDWEFQYSSDGETFVSVSNFTVSDSWSNHTENLTSLVDLNNEENVSFRLVAASNPTHTAGTARVDNFTVSGLSTIPEPTTYAAILGACALVGVVIARRRMFLCR